MKVNMTPKRFQINTLSDKPGMSLKHGLTIAIKDHADPQRDTPRKPLGWHRS